MKRKFAIFLILFGTIAAVLSIIWSISESSNENPRLVTFLLLSSPSAVFLGIAGLFLNYSQEKLRKTKNIVFLISAAIIGLGVLSRTQDFIGGGAELSIGILFFCFTYNPLELKYKYKKWSPFSNNRFETIALSSIDFIGLNLVLLSILFKLMHWPGVMLLLYSGSIILLVGIIFWNSRFKKEVIRRKESEETIKSQFDQIQIEKQHSEDLLLNILPAEIAEELKQKGKADARNYEKVTILFTDFKNFTSISEKMSGKELIAELNTCFAAFDEIIEKHKIEKIKTIGDAYMAAGGLPNPDSEAPTNTVLAALEMQDFMINRKLANQKNSKVAFEMRAGIHTGPIVAGIVGVKKFQYDVWGDTVNTASRLESAGEVGKVNISQNTYNIVKDYSSFKFEDRGKKEVKGKGLLSMYFVDRV